MIVIILEKKFVLINNSYGILGYLIFHQILSKVLIICKKLLEDLKKLWTLLEGISSLRFFAF